MDRFIESFGGTPDGDLMLCPAAGVAWQRDRAHRVSYDAAYFDKCAGYEGEEIARKINAGRIDLVNRHVGDEAVADIGIGSGEFIKLRPNTFGYDINPKAVAWLRDAKLWVEDLPSFRAFTFWDVIEHLDDPDSEYFRHVPKDAHLFASLPVFEDMKRIRESRHYRPGEHLTYFTAAGFVSWMACHGFRLLERADFETKAGRDSIENFAFRRVVKGLQ